MRNQPVFNLVRLISSEIVSVGHEVFPLVRRQQHGTDRDLRLETQLIGRGEKGISTEKPNVLQLVSDVRGEFGYDDMVQADIVVDQKTVVTGGHKTVVHEEFVVGKSSVCCQNFFTSRWLTLADGRLNADVDQKKFRHVTREDEIDTDVRAKLC